WKHYDAAARQGRQIVLDAAITQRVIDSMLLRSASEIVFGNVEGAFASGKCKTRSSQSDGRAGEVALDAGRGRRLHHFAVPGIGAFGGFGGMAFGAGSGANVRGSGGAGCGGQNRQQHPSKHLEG